MLAELHGGPWDGHTDIVCEAPAAVVVAHCGRCGEPHVHQAPVDADGAYWRVAGPADGRVAYAYAENVCQEVCQESATVLGQWAGFVD